MNDKNHALELWQNAIELDAQLKDIAYLEYDYQYSSRYIQAYRELMAFVDKKL